MKKYCSILFCLFLSFSFSQQTDYVDFTKMNALIEFNPDSTKVFGQIKCEFKILEPTDSIFIDAKQMQFQKATLDGKSVAFNNDSKKLWVISKFKKGKIYTLSFEYEAYPKKALYFLKRKELWNIWSQGQGKYTSNWLPSFDDVNEKVIFNLSVKCKSPYQVLSNGFLFDLEPISDSDYFIWHYNMLKPMSSYLVALVVGQYNIKSKTSKNGIPLEMYYFPEDSLKFEPTYRYTKKMFDFLEDEIGVAYPWQNYKQVPVYDFLYSGMENTSLTVFSDAFMIDSIGFNDKNYVNVNAHELAHQWFGNLVTAKSSEHHWLQEGFATYYALLAEQEVFGEDYYYFKLFENAQELRRQEANGNGTSLLNPKSSSLTFYQRGAWVLHALRSKVGDEVFKKAVINYLEKHKLSSVFTSDFISQVEKFYGKSLTSFFNKWIKRTTFPFEDAIRLIHKQSSYIREYVQVNCEVKSAKCEEYLKYYASDDAKIKVIAQQHSLINKNTFNNSLKVRQAISKYLRLVPNSLKSEYESLLDDKSYITVENALYNLWTSFPSERSKYLSKTRNLTGFNDNNIKLLWLVLHLNTPQYKADSKADIFSQIIHFTNSYQHSELRMRAFDYLKLMNACNDQCIQNLEQAKTHHNWRLVKYAKQLLAEFETTKN